MNSYQKRFIKTMLVITMITSTILTLSSFAQSATSNDYCIQPPFVAQVVPPLLMFVMDKEHRLFTEAYSDSFDLDADGKIETTYKHSIEYYGYFDPNKCYTYSTTANEFNPSNYSTATGTDAAGKATYDRFCSAGKWSGNVLNWLTMSRMDVLKKVLYGGQRVNPDATNKTTLQRVYIPQDAHSFGKEFTGRLCNSGTTYTNMCSTSIDCDSTFSCVDKSQELIGIAAPPAANTCAYTATIDCSPGSTCSSANGKILVATYDHAAGATQDVEIGASHQNILNSFVPANFIKYYYINDFGVDDTTAANNDLIPSQNHGSSNSFIAEAEFNVKKKSSGNPKYDYTGTWTFFLDSDDGAELYIDGTPVASYYSVAGTAGHSSCATAPTTACVASQVGTINLGASGYHNLIVRVTNFGGNSGAKVWYKRPGDATWTVFGAAPAGQNSLELRSPVIPDTSANCTMKTSDFITTGVPTKGVLPGFHLFCNKSVTGNNSYGAPLLRLLPNRTERIWDWISREVVQCGDTLGTGTAVTPTDYNVNIEVCNPTIGLEPNCKTYGTGNSATKKPIGLLQKYGDSDGTKVCSKTLAKTCSSDSDCRASNNGGLDLGMCVDKSQMYFGLISGSYAHNLQGGVLRKNILSISDEVDSANGFFKTSQNIPSNMLETLDKLQIVGYTDATTNYANCVAQNQSIVDGKCSVWGNPLAEMLYETFRYYAGKGTPTTAFDYPQNQTDGGLNLPHPSYWGYKDGSTVFKGPYDIFPSCAKPFVLLLSDVFPSFDADQLPGVTGSATTEDTSVHPVLGLDQTIGGKKYLSKLLDDIAATESVTNNNFFIGDNGTTYDFVCTPKTASGMSLLRGLCPEMPTRKGSFYSAALAYYGHSFMNAEIKKDTTSGINTNIPNSQTFAVGMASLVGNWTIKAGANTLRIVPLGKSVSGAVSMKASCADKMNLATSNFSDGTFKTLTMTPKAGVTDAYCPTDEIVKVFTHSIKYNSSGDPIYLNFRINYADAEQGADYDMDAVGWYEVCTQAAKDAGYGTCGTDMDSNQVEIKVVSDYAAGGIDQVLGFIVSGTSEDGSYLVVRDKSVVAGTDTPATVSNLPFNWSHTFTVTGGSSGTLKDPLWYAAKWGGFQDKNGNNVPDLKEEWAKNCTESDTSKCNPDNYYLVTNPLRLESQLEKAFTDILSRVSSGTAASILNNSEGSGANLIQAVFYPLKPFDSQTEAKWIGEIQNLWYYLDPALQKTSIREDTNQNNTLNLKTDMVAQFYFDSNQNKTQVKRFLDSNGDGAADNPDTPVDTVSPDEVNSLWKAGRLLWNRNLATDPRTIYTGFHSTPQAIQKFSVANADGYLPSWPSFQVLTQTGDGVASNATFEAKATKLINYIHGSNQADDADGTKYRDRKVTILGCGLNDAQGCTREWKLGDIVSSTPKLVSNVKLNGYSLTPPNGYNDTTYNSFINTPTYKNRGMVFVGANDGMLHAFKLGTLKELTTRFDKAQINNEAGVLATLPDKLGREEWAYIPTQALPYLKYLADPAYNHLYYIDRTSTVVDASVGVPAGCTSDYSDCTKQCNANDATQPCTWKTILIGGMGIGGAVKPTTDSCTAPANCVKTPVAGTGFSSYFALDVTDPVTPKFLWEFYGNSNSPGSLGYSTTGPAIVRITKKDALGTPNHSKNGKWFAVFGSGPTGPIDTTLHEFKGQSDQTLKIFIVDLASGALVRTIDTGIANAFASSLATSWVDTDRSNAGSTGYYGDDAIYVGYVQKDTTVTPNTWSKGGVIRILTRESDDPDSAVATKKWSWSTVINNIGPVTSSVTKLQDRRKNTLWLYFGTGRFFFKGDDSVSTSQQKLYGIKEPCYSTYNRTMQTPVAGGTSNDIDHSCSDAATSTVTTTCTGSSTALCNQSGDATTAPAASLPETMGGWVINLDQSNSSSLAERVITDPVASPSGAVFFTTFKPSADICKFGGDSLIWAVNYATGGLPPANAMQGKALMQVSTGAFAELSLATAFRNSGNQRLDGRRLSTPISGVPPTAQGLSLITNPPPVKKVLHVREK